MTAPYITRAEYADTNKGWTQYKSFRRRRNAEWEIERLDEPNTQFALVDCGDFCVIARRESFAGRN